MVYLANLEKQYLKKDDLFPFMLVSNMLLNMDEYGKILYLLR